MYGLELNVTDNYGVIDKNRERERERWKLIKEIMAKKLFKDTTAH